jgi:ketosteroid isomerase-like protein
MAALDVMRRYLATVQAGDWEGMYAFFSDDVVGHVPGRSSLAGELRGRAAVRAYTEAARAKSSGADVQVQLLEMLASEERVMLLVRERFAREREIVEIERANVYTVRDGQIAEVWIFEADQYAVDQLLAAS